MNKVFFLILFVIAASVSIFPHEGEKHKSKKDNLTTIDSTSKTEKMEHSEKHENHKTTQETYVIDYFLALREHLHNKTVHFTIALTLAGILFTFLNFKWHNFELTIKILALLSAISGLLAYFTGLNQAKVFLDEPIYWVVNLHRNLGIITGILLIVWSIFLFNKKLNKYSWIIALVLFIMVLITGFYGGIVAAS